MFVYLRPAAGLLMNFSRGCDAVLGLMGPLTAPSSPSCGSDGYHSDSDSEDTYTELVRQYKTLYIKHRADTLYSLDNLPQLKQGQQLKAKILFSIIVVSFNVFTIGFRFLVHRLSYNNNNKVV